MKERLAETIDTIVVKVTGRLLLLAFTVRYQALHRIFTVLSLFLFFILNANAQSSRNGVGPDQRYYAVHDYENDWVIFDEAAKTYIPYLPEVHGNVPALSATVDLESNRQYKLLLYSDVDAYVFINAALRKQVLAGQWHTLSVDSLYKAHRQPQVFLTVYSSAGLGKRQLIMAYPKSIFQKPVVLSDDNLSVRPRPFSVYQNFFGLGLLFLLATHAFLFSLYGRAFLVLYDPRDLFALRVRDESFLINRPLSLTVLLFVLNLSFVMGYLVLFVQSRNVNVFSSKSLLIDQQNFGALLLYYLLISVLVFLSFLGKYLMLQVVGSLYRFESIVNIHFFKVVQSSLLFFTILGFIAAILIFNGPTINELTNYLLIPFTIFYLARLVLLYLVIRAQAPIKSLYLISYLCIVELVPLLIGVRFAL